MNDHPPLRPDQYYHIYNRANGDENLFRTAGDYNRFIRLYDRYISPVADTFAWVLMPNHFHVLVQIKGERYYKYSKKDFKADVSQSSNGGRSARADVPQPSNADRSVKADAVRFEEVKWETVDPSASEGPDGIGMRRKKANPVNHFSHLFNAYAKYVNEKYGRHGSLFQRPFRRKLVEDDDYLLRVIAYIHNNPVHHGFVDRQSDYPWSSYHTCLSGKRTKLQREAVMDLFGGLVSFEARHRDSGNDMELDAWLDLDEN